MEASISLFVSPNGIDGYGFYLEVLCQHLDKAENRSYLKLSHYYYLMGRAKILVKPVLATRSFIFWTSVVYKPFSCIRLK